ncbi:TPA: hypothetical protein ACPPNC_001140, partial [Haemophilus influenzae]
KTNEVKKWKKKKENSLSENDKELIKQTVLNSVENGCLEPELLARRCCEALERINRYGEQTSTGRVGINVTNCPECI